MAPASLRPCGKVFLAGPARGVVVRDPGTTLNTGAYTSEIIRGGIQAVPFAIEAAKACGMNAVMRFRRIVFPQAIRQALPAYGNEIILMIKSTPLASTITLLEMTGTALS